jgi:hypothetical protein
VLLTLVISADLVTRNSAATARTANAIETLATGLAAIRRDLAGAHFIRIGPKPEDAVLFSGGAQAVALAVADDGTRARDGESLILIEARYEGGLGVLVRSSAPMRPGTRGFSGAQFGNHAILLSGPWKYRFSYGEAGTAAGWRSDWNLMNRMPAAVRLEVLSDAGRPVLPPLVVRMHIDSGGCAEPARVDCAARFEESESQDENPEDGDAANDGR